jgi:hypothetical protein
VATASPDQGAAHLLQHDAELAEAEALAAIGLGNADGREAKLGVELAPDLALPTRLGFHEAADFFGGRAFGEEAAQI